MDLQDGKMEMQAGKMDLQVGKMEMQAEKCICKEETYICKIVANILFVSLCVSMCLFVANLTVTAPCCPCFACAWPAFLSLRPYLSIAAFKNPFYITAGRMKRFTMVSQGGSVT